MKPTLLIGALLLLGVKPISAKVAEIVKDPTKFDGKAVIVKGKVDHFKAKVSKAGNDYYVFDLVDGKDKLAVYGGDKLKTAPKDGDTVTVTGKFAKERKVGTRTFKNEIDASVRIDKSFGVKK